MKCPGQDTQYWKQGDIFEISCPECGEQVEFFKDDTSRVCKKCGHKFANPTLDFGCAQYCKFAKQCIGNSNIPSVSKTDGYLKDKVAIEMKSYFKKDFKRIGHATRVARYAERIGKQEKGDMAVILSAAYLHDIGIHEAERKYNSTAARYQEQEGHPIARGILEKLKAPQELINEVCDIIGHHHSPRKQETLNFKVLYDADLIANLEDNHEEKSMDKDFLEKIMAKSFFTQAGKSEAIKVLLAADKI